MKTTEIANRIRSRLPHTTQRLVRTLGWEGALKFLRVHGHRRCFAFPRKLNSKHGLFAGLSTQQAQALLDEFKGEDITLPDYRKMLKSERYQQIAHDYQSRGFTRKMLEDKYQLPRPTIVWIIENFDLEG